DFASDQRVDLSRCHVTSKGIIVPVAIDGNAELSMRVLPLPAAGRRGAGPARRPGRCRIAADIPGGDVEGGSPSDVNPGRAVEAGAASIKPGLDPRTVLARQV